MKTYYGCCECVVREVIGVIEVVKEKVRSCADFDAVQSHRTKAVVDLFGLDAFL